MGSMPNKGSYFNIFYFTKSFRRPWRESVFLQYGEAVAQRWSVKKVFLKTSQNSQESTYVEVSLQIKMHLKQGSDFSFFL